MPKRERVNGLRIGVDVGGTKCLAVALDDHDRVTASMRLPTPAGAVALIDVIVEAIDAVVPASGSDGTVATLYGSVGIGVPGLVTRTGTLLAAPNLVAVEHFEVARLLRDRLGTEVLVDNDATCALLGEARVGAAVGQRDVLMVALGTGIGGGILADGRVVRGANGFAGEFGHMVIDPDGPQCPCGRRGCWERFASGSALAAQARAAARAGRLHAVVELAGGDIDSIRGEHVQSAAQGGDAGALAVIEEFARWVALGLVNLTNAFDPAMIVLGGGLAVGAEVYLEPIRRCFADLLYSPDLRPHPVLRFAALGEHAGAIGAALLGETR